MSTPEMKAFPQKEAKPEEILKEGEPVAKEIKKISKEEFEAQLDELSHALKLHFRIHYYSTVIKLKSDPEEIMEDLIQETLFKASLKLDKFDGKFLLKTWVLAIFKNNFIDYLRKKN